MDFFDRGIERNILISLWACADNVVFMYERYLRGVNGQELLMQVLSKANTASKKNGQPSN